MNLVDHPWIPVRTGDTVTHVGLREALVNAHHYSDLVGDSPTQTVALHRLLLAVTHAALAGPATVPDWAGLWQAGRLPADTLTTYLDKHTAGFAVDRFAQAPPDLDSRHLPVGAVTIWRDLKGLGTFPPNAPEELTAAEAARHLVTCHAWDTGGIRGKHGGNREAGVTAGPLVYGTQVRPVADTLAKTLLLSLLPYQPAPGDLGWWHPDRVEPLHRRRDHAPAGRVHAYTWSSRRIRLHLDPDGLVRTVQVTAGDDSKQLPDDPLRFDTPWILADSHHPRPRWLAALLGADDADLDRPPVLDGLGDLYATGVVDPDEPVRVELTGLDTKMRSVTVNEGHLRLSPLPAATYVRGTSQHAEAMRALSVYQRTMAAVAEALTDFDQAVRAGTALPEDTRTRVRGHLDDLDTRITPHLWDALQRPGPLLARFADACRDQATRLIEEQVTERLLERAEDRYVAAIRAVKQATRL